MAIVALGGLLTAVLLNMLVVPALFLRYGARAHRVESPEAHAIKATLALEPR